MKFGVVVFPGSNCDRDCFHAASDIAGQDVVYLWHKERDLQGVDCIIFPGGFSYGDYLRAGAIASRSPIVNEIADFAAKGGLVIGICNGFQVLTEMQLLPGALMRNKGLTFVCKDVFLKVENNKGPFTTEYKLGDLLRIPIAHMDGNYFASDDVVKELYDNNQVVFRYCDNKGAVLEEVNPNGSIENIAGICNKEGNVLGMMPHPERLSEGILGGVDGKKLFESIVSYIG